MRLSTYFRISILTGAVMTPAMAQDAEQAQQEALRRLRATYGTEASASSPNSSANPGLTTTVAQQTPAPSNIAHPGGFPSSAAIEEAKRKLRSAEPSVATSTGVNENPGLTVRPSLERSRETEAEVQKLRNEREQRLQEEARQADAARRQKLSDKSRKWEVDIAERERLRQRQREYDESVARELGGRNTPTLTSGQGATKVTTLASVQHGTSSPDYVQQLQERAKRLSSSSESSAGPVTHATPQIDKPTSTEAASLSSPVSNSSVGAASDDAAIEARALEILRQNKASSGASNPTPSTGEIEVRRSSTTPAPTAEISVDEETVRKAREALRSQTPASSGSSNVSAPAPVSRNPETRGMEVLRQQAGQSRSPGSTPARPELDASTREIIEKQNRQIGTTGSEATSASKTIGVEGSTPASNDADALQAKAREVLRQQQERTDSTSTTVTTTSPQPGNRPTPPTNVSNTAASSAPQVNNLATGTVTIAPGNDAPYSAEAEARAKQLLRERGTAETAPSSAGSNVAVTTTPTPSGSVDPDQDLAAAQAQALRALRSHQSAGTVSGSVSAPKVDLNKGGSRNTPSAASTVNRPPEVQRNNATATTVVPTQTVAPSTGSGTKRQRLAELTQAYFADKMTPAEYHAARAKILAEPDSK